MTAATYLDQYQSLAPTLPGQGVDWLAAQRSAALARFTEVGFPTSRDENWRYTSTQSLTAKKFHPAADSANSVTNSTDSASKSAKSTDSTAQNADSAIDLAALLIPNLDSHRLVFVDGLFAPHLSTPESEQTAAGITLKSLAWVLDNQPQLIEHALGALLPRHRHGFTALNNAHSRDGAVVLLGDSVAATRPLELLFINRAAGGFNQPRNVVVAAAASAAAIIERHVCATAEASFTNSVTEILLSRGAAIDYHLVQTQCAAAYHICGVWARLAGDSRLRCRTATLGAALARNDLAVELGGRGAHCDMLGLYNLKHAQHADNHTTVTHAAEHCTSRELYKGVLDQRARAVFHGRIVVARGAQKTAAAQTNNTLLLSPHAEIDAKPQLEIYADDVKCSHGATVGRLEGDALFYLRARGLDEDAARALLTLAFVQEVVDEIDIEALREALGAALAAGLAHPASAQPTAD